MNQDKQRKLAIECGGTELDSYTSTSEGNTTAILLTMRELAAYTSAVEAPLQARIVELQNQNTFDAIRLRTLASKCGIAVPESNEELLCVAGVVLGTIRRVIDGVYEHINSLQARIAQLEHALHHISLCHFNSMSSREEMGRLSRKVLGQTSDTWLSEHDKAVEAKERERCAKVAEGGSFLHENAPTAIFGRECAKAIRRMK